MFIRNLDIKRDKLIDELFGKESVLWNDLDDQRPFKDSDNFLKLMNKIKSISGGKVSKIEVIIILLLILTIYFVEESIVRWGVGAYLIYWFFQVFSVMTTLEGIHIGWDAERRISEKEIYNLTKQNIILQDKISKLKSKRK